MPSKRCDDRCPTKRLMRIIIGFFLVVSFGVHLCSCSSKENCSGDTRECNDGVCRTCCSDEDCEPDKTCLDGECIGDPCEGVHCSTSFCPRTGTFECTAKPVTDPTICTCPVEGGCEYTEFIENCAHPPDCVCIKGECIREVDCPFGLTCSGEPPSCDCVDKPVECVDANRTCDEIRQDMLKFHADNLSCSEKNDCRTIVSYTNLVDNVCCNVYLSMYANAGIWHALENQLGWHEPICDEFLIEVCCEAPPPQPICIDGICGLP